MPDSGGIAPGEADGGTTPFPCTAQGFGFSGLMPGVLFEASVDALVLGDVNGDGKTDMVATLAALDTVAVALGIGDGTFVQGSRNRTGVGPGATMVADLDGDGIPDLATANADADSVSIRCQPPGL